MATLVCGSWRRWLAFLVILAVLGSLYTYVSTERNYIWASTPNERPPSAAEKYALELQQAYQSQGFDVKVLSFDNEHMLVLRSEEFRDYAAREAVAGKLWENRRKLCGIGIWYAKVGYSNGLLSGDTRKSLSLGCPDAKAARERETADARRKYAAGLSIPSEGVLASARDTTLVFEWDAFADSNTRSAFLKRMLSSSILTNLCHYEFTRLQLRTKKQAISTTTVPCK